jgi:hypothetical protein
MKTLQQVALAFNATHMMEKSEGRTHVLPQEDTLASLAIIATHLLKKSEGGAQSPYEDTRASSARKISASHMLKQSEGNNNHRVRDVDVSISPLLSHHCPSLGLFPHFQPSLTTTPPDLCHTIALNCCLTAPPALTLQSFHFPLPLLNPPGPAPTTLSLRSSAQSPHPPSLQTRAAQVSSFNSPTTPP